MVTAQIVILVFAVLMLVGGVMGARAGSKASLRAGSVSAAMLLVALWLSFGNAKLGYGAAAAIGAVLAIVFGKRLAATGKMMPSGMLLGVSLIAAVFLAYTAFQAA